MYSVWTPEADWWDLGPKLLRMPTQLWDPGFILPQHFCLQLEMLSEVIFQWLWREWAVLEAYFFQNAVFLFLVLISVFPLQHIAVFFQTIFLHFLQLLMVVHFLILQLFCTMSCNIPSAESLGQRKSMYLCPYNMALGSRRVYTSYMELYDFRWERNNWSRWILRELFICKCISGSLWFKCLWAKLQKKYFSFKNSLWRA